MGISSKQIQKLGDRLREGEPTVSDLELLDEFRREFDELLLHHSANITQNLAAENIRFLLSGRAKRTKSILRKLRRPRNKNMDLSRMDDIVGLRIIVADRAAQQQVIDQIVMTQPQVREPFDYRDMGPDRYRAVHLVVGQPSRRVEVQVRTCTQHLWADSCERFGERAKEGDPAPDEILYLTSLGKYCIAAEHEDSSDHTAPEHKAALDRLVTRFFEETRTLGSESGRSHVVVYEIASDQLMRCEFFPATSDGRKDALEFYRYQSSILSESKFDVLVLNSRSATTLKVTHPRYFPE